jgi:hypothetical protein
MALFRSTTQGLRSGSPQVQTVRVNLGVFTASQVKDITITWPFPFVDTNYTVACTLVEPSANTANSDAFRQVLTQTAASILVRIASGSTGYSDGQLFLHAIGWHD